VKAGVGKEHPMKEAFSVLSVLVNAKFKLQIPQTAQILREFVGR